MALQFQQPPIEPFLMQMRAKQAQQEQKSPQAFNQNVTTPLMESFRLWQQNRSLQREQQMQDQAQKREWEGYGTTPMPMTQETLPQGVQGPLNAPQVSRNPMDWLQAMGKAGGMQEQALLKGMFGMLPREEDNIDKQIKQMSLLKGQSELNKPIGSRTTTQEFDDESKLRDTFNKLSAPFYQTAESYQRINNSVKNPSAAGDLALIFNYMKMLDPGSTVREGEFATAQNSASVPEIIRARYNKIINGERLSDETRKDFYERASNLYSGQEGLHMQREQEFRRLANEYNLNPSRVFTKTRGPAYDSTLFPTNAGIPVNGNSSENTGTFKIITTRPKK